MVVLSLIFAPHQETENLYLEVFFNTQFNRSSNPNANIETFSRFGCSYTVDLTAHTCNLKKTAIIIYCLLDYLKKMITLNQLSIPFRVDFRSLLEGVGKYTI